ncbi:MAG: iron ABC transporter permease [Clostridiaceae bacterium]|jgi:iron(III) transport system permease protein|nr:iron ABC transporter permease [Clostridiaceae bacterium]
MGRKTRLKLDFWSVVTIAIFILFAFFLAYPLFSLFAGGFRDPNTQQFTLNNFIRFFTKKYYTRALWHSFLVTTCTTLLSVAVGAPLAYLTTVYKTKGTGLINTLIIISMLSPPFIGAYSWILLCGRSGILTALAENLFHIKTPSIYGFGGILLVLTLKLYPFIYLYTKGALQKVDSSLFEAAESLGCSGYKKVFTVIFPLITPTILAGALLVFMNALADFGTPMLIGEGYTVMPVLIYSEFISETGGQANFAAALAVIMVIITGLMFWGQKSIVNKRSYTMSSLHPIRPKKLQGAKNVALHLVIYFVTFLAIIPQITVIFTSFKATKGAIFTTGFSLESYRKIFSNLGRNIVNTYLFGLTAIAIIVLIAIFIAYITIRKKTWLTNAIDSLTMFPYIIPGSVLGITLLLAFNKKPFLLSGTAAIIIIAFVIRRLPYTLRSSSAILYQISPSLEEAAISLGDTPPKAFFKVTSRLMMPGVLSGAILSWITIINELSASVILYTGKTRTMSVSIYTEVIRASYGTAAALAAMLTLTTIVSLLIFFRLSGKKDISI